MSPEPVDRDQEQVELSLDGLGRVARATPVRGAPRLAALVRRARQRRRHRRVGAALAAVAVLVPVGLGIGAATTDDQDRSERVTTDPRATEPGGPTTTTDPTVLLDPVEGTRTTSEVVPLAPGPLSAREAMASVWTGRELLVWGGAAGGQVDGRTFADGAAYDPATDTWRTMAPSPLGARARAAAVWTGSEMLVWGGSSSAYGPGDVLDGAAYDPAADTWRPIAAAPPGSDRSFASAAWVAGRMVVGGGSTPSAEVRDVLVYDLDADTWSEAPIGADVVQVVATADRVAVLTWDPSVRTAFAVSWLDPATGMVLEGPSLDVGTSLDHLGAVWTGTELVALGRGTDDGSGPVGLVASVAPDEPTWHDRRLLPTGSALAWPPAVGFMGEPALLAWTGSDVVAFGRNPSRYDPATGRSRLADLNLDALGDAGCGYDAAQAWTGTEVIWWGGQWCRGNEPVSQAATGARVVLPPP